jgi:hypothetical protein
MGHGSDKAKTQPIQPISIAIDPKFKVLPVIFDVSGLSSLHNSQKELAPGHFVGHTVLRKCNS